MPLTRQKVMGWGTPILKKVSFSTTDTTVEVDTDGLKRVAVFGLVHHGDNGANDRLEVDETSDADGVITVPAAGTITIKRAASGTSGLTIGVFMVGY